MSRYDRQLRIENWAQEQLTNATVLMAGMGALGCFVATNLVLSGVGRLILVDMDTIEVSNLNRQFLFRERDVREYKSEVAAQRLHKMNPDVEIISLPRRIEEIQRSYYKKSDIIVAGLDTYATRRWLNSLAVHLEKPFITGGMYGFTGQVQRIIPYKTACFECQPLIPQDQLSQECSPLGELRKNQQSKKEKIPMPAIATISMIIGGIMSQEIIKVLMDYGSPLDNYLFYDGKSNTTTMLKLERNYNCPVCGEFYDLEEATFIVENGETIKAVTNRLAYAFGLAQPEVMLRGIILDPELVITKNNLKSGSKLFVMDKRLAKPLKIVVKKQKKHKNKGKHT